MTNEADEAALLLPPAAIELLHQRPCGYYDAPYVPPIERQVIVKWFTPMSRWTWWVFEGDPNNEIVSDAVDDWYLYGLVKGLETEWGYFTYSSIQALNESGDPMLQVQRDFYYTQEQWRADFTSFEGL